MNDVVMGCRQQAIRHRHRNRAQGIGITIFTILILHQREPKQLDCEIRNDIKILGRTPSNGERNFILATRTTCKIPMGAYSIFDRPSDTADLADGVPFDYSPNASDSVTTKQTSVSCKSVAVNSSSRIFRPTARLNRSISLRSTIFH
jgi:hypothetical protein